MKEFSHLDLMPYPLHPNKRNGKTREAEIYKRMDKFLVNQIMVNHLIDIRSYTIQTFVSGHFPIMLTWDEGE